MKRHVAGIRKARTQGTSVAGTNLDCDSSKVNEHYHDQWCESRDTVKSSKFHGVNRNASFRDRSIRQFSLFFMASAVVFSFLISISTLSGFFRKRAAFFPRYVKYIVEDDREVKFLAMDLNMDLYPSKRTVPFSSRALQEQERLLNSKDYDHQNKDEFETSNCKAQYAWQKKSFPTCNSVMEVDLTDFRTDGQAFLIGNGYWRDVWIVPDSLSVHERKIVVLKTIRYEHDYTDRNYDRHRRDAVAMERLTNSPMVVNIFAFCGNTGVFEFATGGDLLTAIWPPQQQNLTNSLTSAEKLEIATQVAMGIAATHNIDREGHASIAHTDITPGQFIRIGGLYKLNDFNRARFIRWNEQAGKPCGYRVGRNPGKNRSPEEYKHDSQSEKVDVFSMGNIFYMLLTGLWPFEELNETQAKKEVMKGNRPPIPPDIWRSNDTIVQTLKEAMIMCHRQNPSERESARQVEIFLTKKLVEVKPDVMAHWGFVQKKKAILKR